MSKTNRCIILAQRPRYGVPTRDMFRMESVPASEPREGQVLVRTLLLAIDPYLYGRVASVSQHSSPLPLGSVMDGATVGRVEASHHPRFAVGDLVHGAWGWQDYHVTDGSDLAKVDPELPRPSYELSALGLSGFAGYIAVNELLQVKPGETLSFGAALGGVGQIVGQLGKLRGARVVAISGGAEKCRYAEEQLGFDVCLDRKAADFKARLETEFSKSGVDCIVMAVGPGGLQAAMPHFRNYSRIAVCGLIGSYSAATPSAGQAQDWGGLVQEVNRRRLRMFGVVAKDLRGTPLDVQFRKDMKQWILEGKIKPVEHMVEGLEGAPDMMRGVFEGRNFGKAIVRISD